MPNVDTNHVMASLGRSAKNAKAGNEARASEPRARAARLIRGMRNGDLRGTGPGGIRTTGAHSGSINRASRTAGKVSAVNKAYKARKKGKGSLRKAKSA